MSGAEINDRIFGNSRRVIKITPRVCDFGTIAAAPGPVDKGGSHLSIYNSCQSLSSCTAEKEPRVLFLGFNEMWERDLWSSWLTEVSCLLANLDDKIN